MDHTNASATPNRETVRQILAAAADVVFSDGVSDAFLEQWTDETLFVLGMVPAPSRSPRG